MDVERGQPLSDATAAQDNAVVAVPQRRPPQHWIISSSKAFAIIGGIVSIIGAWRRVGRCHRAPGQRRRPCPDSPRPVYGAPACFGAGGGAVNSNAGIGIYTMYAACGDRRRAAPVRLTLVAERPCMRRRFMGFPVALLEFAFIFEKCKCYRDGGVGEKIVKVLCWIDTWKRSIAYILCDAVLRDCDAAVRSGTNNCAARHSLTIVMYLASTIAILAGVVLDLTAVCYFIKSFRHEDKELVAPGAQPAIEGDAYTGAVRWRPRATAARRVSCAGTRRPPIRRARPTSRPPTRRSNRSSCNALHSAATHRASTAARSGAAATRVPVPTPLPRAAALIPSRAVIEVGPA